MGNILGGPTKAVEFVPGEELGRGSYGRVFKAKYRGSVCAAKEIHSILIEGSLALLDHFFSFYKRKKSGLATPD